MGQCKANGGRNGAHNDKGQAIMASVFKRGGKGNRGGYWYVSWFDHTGRRKSKCARTTDKATAEQIGAKLETEAAKRREGLIDPQLEGFVREARRPLAELVTEYKSKLVANGRTDRYIAEAVGYIERFAEAEEIKTAAQFTAERMAHFAEKVSDAGKSARTVQATIGAAKSFTRWLVACGKLPRDPLASVSKPSPENDRRRERRMLLPDEWPHLIDATVKGPERNGMTGAERALLYRLAIATGLRSNELRSLTRTSVVLDATRPYVRVKGADTKNGKAAQQFIDRELAEALRGHMTAKTPAARLFPMPDRTWLARMLRADLATARKAWLDDAERDAEELTRREQSDFLAEKNHAGEWFDFHSLRHTCGAWLSLSGAHPKTVQTVMRHSTPVLTMNRYGHMLPGAEAEAADRLGAMVSLAHQPSDENENVVRMTGTEGGKGRSAWRSSSGRVSRRNGAAACGAKGSATDGRDGSRDAPQRLGPHHVTLDDATACDAKQERRAWDSNPQPVSRHLNSNQAANHSLTLRSRRPRQLVPIISAASRSENRLRPRPTLPLSGEPRFERLRRRQNRRLRRWFNAGGRRDGARQGAQGLISIAGVNAVNLFRGGASVNSCQLLGAALVALGLTAPAAAADRPTSAWVHPGDDGKLVYRTTETGDRIMDFSHAGYMGGGVALPDVPVKKTIKPTGGDDDAAAIQAAIDEVAALPLEGGFRGAVLLEPGIYRCGGTINITASGVVLRGSGATGESRSTLLLTGRPHAAIAMREGGRGGRRGRGGRQPRSDGEGASSRRGR